MATLSRPLRVFLAEDHAIMRAGLRMLISTQEDMQVVGEAADGGAALDAIGACSPDVVVMDVSMPSLSGPEATMRLRGTSPDTKVLVLSAYVDPANIAAMLAAGASGYIAKHRATEDLIGGIRRVAGGERFFNPATQSIVDRLPRRDPR